MSWFTKLFKKNKSFTTEIQLFTEYGALSVKEEILPENLRDTASKYNSILQDKSKKYIEDNWIKMYNKIVSNMLKEANNGNYLFTLKRINFVDFNSTEVEYCTNACLMFVISKLEKLGFQIQINKNEGNILIKW